MKQNDAIQPIYDHIHTHLSHVQDKELHEFITCFLRLLKNAKVHIHDISELKEKLSNGQWRYLANTYLNGNLKASDGDVRRRIAAWQTNDKIFINLKQPLLSRTQDFVHEFLHFLRKSSQQGMDRQIEEEIHSFVAEHLILKMKVPEKSLKRFVNMICEKIDHPTYGKLPRQPAAKYIEHIYSLIHQPTKIVGKQCACFGGSCPKTV